MKLYSSHSVAAFQVAFAAVEDCLWQWSSKQRKGGDWEDIPGASQPVYTPQQADQGSHLRVISTPSRVRQAVSLPSDNPHVHVTIRND